MKSWMTAIFSLVAVLLLTASLSGATSIPIRTGSSYGISGFSLEAGSQTDVDGIQESLGCASSTGDCTSPPTNFNLLVVSIPNLAPGTVITFLGLSSSPSIYCESTLFLNQAGCTDPFSASTSQQACVDSLNLTSVSGGFQVTAASCALATSLGSNSMTLIFGDAFGSQASFATSVTAKSPTSTPEPGTLMLIGTGLLGLVGRKRLRA